MIQASISGRETQASFALFPRPRCAGSPVGPSQAASAGDRSSVSRPFVLPRHVPFAFVPRCVTVDSEDAMTVRTTKTNPLMAELQELGRSLQHMGRTLADVTANRVTTAADETLAAAEDALTTAKARVKTARTQLRRTRATRHARA